MGTVGLAGSISTWTIGLSAPGGLVDNHRRHKPLRVHFTADDKGDASKGGGGEGGGGSEVGGEAMILYTTTYKM